MPSTLLLPTLPAVSADPPSRVLLVVRRKGWAVGSMLLPLIMVVPFGLCLLDGHERADCSGQGADVATRNAESLAGHK